jgi:hypothetical protein
MRQTAAALPPDLGTALSRGIDALSRASDWLRARLKDSPDDALAGAMPYLNLFGLVVAGHHLGRGALSGEPKRIALATFYARNNLPQVEGLAAAAMAGADALEAAALD